MYGRVDEKYLILIVSLNINTEHQDELYLALINETISPHDS